MEMTDFQRKMAALLPDVELKFNESMARHTSLRIGGGAEVMAFPKNKEELAKLVKQSALLDCTPAILGAGTNVLAPDEGLPGLVICLKDCLTGQQQLDETHIRLAAGVTMARGAVFAANLGLSGLEFSHGIPGTVGGGVYMNAGAYGGEMGQVVTQVEVLTREGQFRTFRREEMGFSYRHSRMEGSGDIVVSADFALTPGEPQQIWDRMKELIGKRTASQPLDLPSAGSAFKRPETGYASALIDQAGLRGFQVGDAAISQKHTGFAVNLGKATAADMRQLLQQVSQRVLENSGVALEPEIRIW